MLIVSRTVSPIRITSWWPLPSLPLDNFDLSPSASDFSIVFQSNCQRCADCLLTLEKFPGNIATVLLYNKSYAIHSLTRERPSRPGRGGGGDGGREKKIVKITFGRTSALYYTYHGGVHREKDNDGQRQWASDGSGC